MASYLFQFRKYAKLLDLANLRLNKFPTYTLLNEYLAVLLSADCVVVIFSENCVVVVVTLAEILTDSTVFDCFVGVETSMCKITI